MNVYIVRAEIGGEDLGGFTIEGVFSTKEKADKFVLDSMAGWSMNVWKYTIDKEKPIM